MPLSLQAIRSHTPRGRTACRLAMALLMMAIVTPVAWGQNYKADEVAQNLSKNGGLAKRYAKNGSGDEALFKQYIEQYFFPSMTMPTAEGLADLERSQSDLFKYYLPGTTQAYVNKQATEFAVRVTNDRQYHPAVRYNAMLILGRLMDDYANKAPSTAANAELCKWADRGATNDRVYGYELAGALIGLERHTRLKDGLGKDEARRSMASLYKVLRTDKLPMPLDTEVSDWLYLTAAKGIGNFGTPGPRNGLFAALIAKKVADSTISLETRSAMAAELSRMGLKPDNVNAAPVIKIVSDLAQAVAEEESEIAEKFEDMQIGGAARFQAGGRGKLSRRIREGGTSTSEQGPVYVREGLLQELTDLRKGVRAVKGIATGESQGQLEAVEQAVTDAIRVVGNKDRGDLNVAGAVRTMAREIEDTLRVEDPADLADAQ